MAIIRWDPFKDIVTLRDRMNKLFEEAFAGQGEKTEMVSGSWYPSVDIHEKANELVLTAELPGVDEKDIDIEVEPNSLTIKGRREMEKETKEEDYHRIERSYGSFYRSFSFLDHARPLPRERVERGRTCKISGPEPAHGSPIPGSSLRTLHGPSGSVLARELEEAAGKGSQDLPSRQRSPPCASGHSDGSRDPLSPKSRGLVGGLRNRGGS